MQHQTEVVEYPEEKTTNVGPPEEYFISGSSVSRLSIHEALLGCAK
jgi:hypothetical protein